MSRTCPRGHVVAEDDLRNCPHCGGSLPPTGVKVRSLAPEQARAVVEVPKTVPFLVAAVLVAIFGALLTYAARRGVAEVFGWMLLAFAATLAVIAVVDLAKRRRSSARP